MILIDAHNHLQSARLAPHYDSIFRQLHELGLQHAVVNGTREQDWDPVANLGQRVSFAIPSFGLHPWYIADRTPRWLESLRTVLLAYPKAGVGEIGLDRWIEGHDLAMQTEVFVAQFALARELNRPATIHCLRAWGALEDLLRQHPAPAKGFLLHAYGGPAEMVPGFVAHGGYFSFNPYFLHERKARQREVFRHIPVDRLLVETDAPEMAPPEDRNSHPLHDAEGKMINDPANILLAYQGLAEIRQMPLESLAEQVAENFARLFG
jgi:TatD DNase family protein